MDYQVVVLNGNVPEIDEEFQIHRKGCRDVKRLRRFHVNVYTARGDSPEAVRDMEAAEMADMDYLPEHFRIMPCCRESPVGKG